MNYCNYKAKWSYLNLTGFNNGLLVFSKTFLFVHIKIGPHSRPEEFAPLFLDFFRAVLKAEEFLSVL